MIHISFILSVLGAICFFFISFFWSSGGGSDNDVISVVKWRPWRRHGGFPWRIFEKTPPNSGGVAGLGWRRHGGRHSHGGRGGVAEMAEMADFVDFCPR